jgi:hypothetical protein
MVRARFSYLRNPKYRHNITFRYKFIYEKYIPLYKIYSYFSCGSFFEVSDFSEVLISVLRIIFGSRFKF